MGGYTRGGVGEGRAEIDWGCCGVGDILGVCVGGGEQK